LAEQRAIAQVLRTLKRAKEATEKVIAATRQLKQSLIRQLFSYGPVPVNQAGQLEMRDSEVGQIPETWEVMRFDQFATLQRGTDLPRNSFREGSIPVIGATSIIGFHDRANVKGPGVTVVRSGSSAGKPLYVDRDFWAHNVVLYVKDFHGNNIRFVYYKMGDLRLTQYRAGVAVPTLNRNAFKNIAVAVPSVHDQDKIVYLLGSVEREILALENCQGALVRLFDSLLHNLMTGKIRVPEFAAAGAR
jgi:type I restriction enzyme, S subunit